MLLRYTSENATRSLL